MATETARFLLERLLDEKSHGISGGVYNMLQVDMAYNSNHIEGSSLTRDQTRLIFDAHALDAQAARVDDIIETANHFRCFDYILDHAGDSLSEAFLKRLHGTLKASTLSSRAQEAVVGDYKRFPNYAGDIETSAPSSVHADVSALLEDYGPESDKTLDDVIDFHARLERIHPFYDGNGRVGRLVLFKECLRNDIVPFVIKDDAKLYYIRGIRQWQTGGERGYLRDTCLAMQDQMKATMDYFEIPYDRGAAEALSASLRGGLEAAQGRAGAQAPRGPELAEATPPCELEQTSLQRPTDAPSAGYGPHL